METIGATDITNRITELADRLAHGETFEITVDGRPVGRLVPTAEETTAKPGRTFNDWLMSAPRLDDILPPRDRSPMREIEL